MKSTVYDYINLVLFFILGPLSTVFFVISFNNPSGNTDKVILAIVFVVITMLVSPGLTNVWFNRYFYKKTKSKEVRFFGRIIELERLRISIGESFRGIVLFLLLFVAPSILVQNWLITAMFTIIFLIPATFFVVNINSYIKYMRNHLIYTPNS